MLLYHYATTKFNLLLTREKQKVITREEREKEALEDVKWSKSHGYKRPGYYFEHVSFFFEPPPLDIIASIFPKDHLVWKSGVELFQHVVDSNNINPFMYEVVEQPEKTAVYYDNTLSDKKYFKIVKDSVIDNNYIGKNSDALEKAASKFIGTTREMFIKIKDRSNYDEIKYKYAATVPHVMLYPHLGKIKPDSISKVKVK